jgi:hypothetical protein
MTDGRNVYFLATTAAPSDSSLASSGVVLYAIVQRALAAGADSLGNTRQFIAGEVPLQDPGNWRQLAGNRDALSNVYQQHAGVYRFDQQLFAINRSRQEDTPTIVSSQRVDRLFEQLDFDRVDDTAGSGVSLVQEIWRLFLAGMMLALVLEAILCFPKRAVPSEASPMGGVAA